MIKYFFTLPKFACNALRYLGLFELSATSLRLLLSFCFDDFTETSSLNFTCSFLPRVILLANLQICNTLPPWFLSYIDPYVYIIEQMNSIQFLPVLFIIFFFEAFSAAFNVNAVCCGFFMTLLCPQFQDTISCSTRIRPHVMCLLTRLISILSI